MRSLSFLLIALPAMAQAVLTINVTYVRNEACGNAKGQAEVQAWGGVPPYTYVWTPTPGIGQGTAYAADLSAGTYLVEVTDAMSATASTNVVILNDPFVSAQLDLVDPHACPNGCDGSVRLWAINGTVPYGWSYTPTQTMGLNLADFQQGWCNGQTATVTFTDANGCPGSASTTMHVPEPTPMAATSIVGACGGANGSFVLETNGDMNSLFGCLIEVRDPNNVLIVNSNITGWGVQIPLVGLLPGMYTASRTWPGGNGCFAETLPILIPDLGGNCGTLSGSLFFDHDQDCVQDVADEGIPYRVLTILPNQQYVITNIDGAYGTNLGPGNYTLDQAPGADLLPLCPAANPVPFVITNGGATVLDVADSSLIPLDLGVQMLATAARPGFIQTVYLTVRNLSGQQSGAVDATFTFDPEFAFVSSVPTPSGVVGNVVTWSGLSAPTAFGSLGFSVQLQLPPNPGLIGTVVTHQWSAFQPNTESSLVNNTTDLSTTVTGSYDPNAKEVRTSTRWSNDLYYIGQDEYLDYVIQFQNTGTDTAFTVAITDTLDADLDMSSFEQGLASHAFSVQFLPERVVKWTFNNILLPDSSTNEALSHGLVSFRIKPAQPLQPGTVMSNAADIFFDFNSAVRTNDAVVTATQGTDVENTAPGSTLSLVPNPTHDRVMIVGLMDPGAIRSIEAFSSDGKRVEVEMIRADRGTLDLSRWPVGAYLLMVWTTDGARHALPLLKR
ncbi:MAG: hypothetical protein ABI599_17380 [Flavobacteriales bacterium]